jgi:thiol:disulfide interchange protein DsbD
MKEIKFILLSIALTLVYSPSFSQIEDPTEWKFEVKKKSATDYQLIFHMSLKKEWHVWSLKPGGDGYEIAPSFTFDKNPNVKLKGEITEKGKPVTTKMAGIDGNITYFADKVDYVQEVTVTSKTKITGKHQYQVCNNKMCLPPMDSDFSFEIK